jgi:hypothetical protein
MHKKNFGKLTDAAIKKQETNSYYSKGFWERVYGLKPLSKQNTINKKDRF